MPRPTSRKEVLDRLRKTIDDGSIIVGAGAGAYFIYNAPWFTSLTWLIDYQESVSLPNSLKKEARISSSFTTPVDSAWLAVVR